MTSPANSPVKVDAARLVALLVPFGLIAGALGSQYLGGLYPCEMCHWQRWPHYAAIGIALLAFVVPGERPKFWLVALAGLAIAASGMIGVFHAGVEYGFWDGITTCTSTVQGSGGSVDEMLARIMAAPMVRCDVPQWQIFHVSLAGFNAAISLAAALAIALLLARSDMRERAA